SCLPWSRPPGSAWSSPQLDARCLLDALKRADRQVAWVHRNRHQTWLRRMAVLCVRALRAHEKPAVDLQSRDDFPCGHAVAIISFTLCPVNALKSHTASFLPFVIHFCYALRMARKIGRASCRERELV